MDARPQMVLRQQHDWELLQGELEDGGAEDGRESHFKRQRIG